MPSRYLTLKDTTTLSKSRSTRDRSVVFLSPWTNSRNAVFKSSEAIRDECAM